MLVILILKIAMAFSLKSFLKAIRYAKEEVGNEFDGRSIVQAKNSKNAIKVKKLAKSKDVKVTSPRTATKAKPFLMPEGRLAFTQLRQAVTKRPILHGSQAPAQTNQMRPKFHPGHLQGIPLATSKVVSPELIIPRIHQTQARVRLETS